MSTEKKSEEVGLMVSSTHKATAEVKVELSQPGSCFSYVEDLMCCIEMLKRCIINCIMVVKKYPLFSYI